MVVGVSSLLVAFVVGQPPMLGGPTPKSLAPIEATVVRLLVSSVYSVAVAPDGKSVACSGHRGRIVVASFPKGEVLHEFKDEDVERACALAFSPDGKRLIGALPGLRVWDLETGKRLISEKWDWEKRTSEVPFRYELMPRPALSPDGKQLYMGGSIDDFRVIEVETGKELKRVRFLGKPANSLAPSPDGKTLVVTTPEALIFFRTDTFAERDRVKLHQDYRTDHRYCVRFPTGSERLFVMGPSKGEHSAEARVWVF